MTDEEFQDIHAAAVDPSSSRISFALSSVDAWFTSREFDLSPDPHASVEWRTRIAAERRSRIRLEGVLTGHLDSSAIAVSLSELSSAISGDPAELEDLFMERGWLYFVQGDYASAHADFDLVIGMKPRNLYGDQTAFGMWAVTLELMDQSERQQSRLDEIWSGFENAKIPRSIIPPFGADANDPEKYLTEAYIKLKLSGEMISRGWKYTADYLCIRDLPVC
jgi:hypothetical protein